MEVDFLLSFRDYPSCQNLDEDILKKFHFLTKSMKNKKKKNNKNSESKKSSTILKEKIQLSKDKCENKFGLLVNKLDNENIDKIIEEFVEKFKDIEENEFLIFQKEIYKRIIKDNKFQDLFLEFFIKIREIYSLTKNYNEKYFINLIETKFKFDYKNEYSEFVSPIEDKESIDDILDLNSEDNRINNIDLILKFIQNNYFSDVILSEISDALVNCNYIPDIYRFFNNSFVKEKYVYSKSQYEKLKNKINNIQNKRDSVLLISILELFPFCNKENLNDLSTMKSIENNIFDNEIYEEDDDINNLYHNVELKNVESFDQYKSAIEIEIGNILEEYLLIEDFEEINNYTQNLDNLPNFLKELFNFYFKNNLNEFDKFKSLFLNFRNNKNINPKLLIESLFEILESDFILDYVNLETKLPKLLEIFQLLHINLNKNQSNSIKNLLSN